MWTAKVGLMLAATLGCGLAGTATGGTPVPPPPQVLLHIPFDGTIEFAFAANERVAPSYLYAAYRPGVRAQGAELGSDRYPSGLVIPCADLLDKARGSIELWYMPVWNPSDPRAQGATRTLVTDEKLMGAVGHFWLGIERGSVVFGWQGGRAVGVAGSIRRWKPETWHHILATWDSASAIRLFLDGDQVGELEVAWHLPPSDLLYIGADRYGGQRSDGLFDEFRLYDRALTPTEVELAFINNLNAKNAPSRPPPVVGGLAAPKEPRLSFHVPFDNLAEAQTAAGDARPLVAEGLQFGPGLLGQALLATTGLKLAYHLDKNLSKEAGAFTVWARSLPEKRSLRRVLLSDDLFALDPAREVPGSFALWLHDTGARRCAFGLWPLQMDERLDRWDEGDWYHFAASWRRGDRVTFYVNGREVGRASAKQATWGTELAKRLCVGSLDGRSPAEAFLDDLRVYDAPLSRDQVQRQASQFLLPLVMVLDRTLYESGRAAELVARFYNILAGQIEARLTVHVLNPEGKEVHSVEGPLEVPPHAWGRFRLPLTAEQLASSGLYEVTVGCDGRVSCPRAYFLAVDPKTGLAGPADPSAAKRGTHEETIECAKRSSRDAFCETGGSSIVRSALGDYREAGTYPDARFAYRFRVERTGVPHVAIVSFPADRGRSAEIIMTSRHSPASQDVATGYFVEEPDAADPKMLKLPIYFWPRERENALVFRTLTAGRPAACAEIVVREANMAAGTPAGGRPEERRRTLGVHWDDPAVPLQFGATGTSPPEVYESFRRLVDCVASAGQNLLCYPVVWRWGTLYPVEAEEFRLGAGAENHCSDWIEYVLSLCERRGIQFLPEIVFDDMAALSAAFGGDDAESVAGTVAGRQVSPSARMVLWDDTLSPGGPGGPPRYNPLHPAVQGALLDRVSEIVERYGKSPALAGVSVRLGPGQSTWFGSIQCGYDDETFGQFTREAGVAPTEELSGPTRFSERARWLLANNYDQWVNFRCRRLRQFYVDLASRVQSKRPALKLYLTVGLPDCVSGYPLVNLTTWANRTVSLDALYREAGLDTSLLKERPVNLIVRRITHPTDDRYLAYRFGSGGPNPHPAAAHDLAFLSEGTAPLVGFPRVAAAISCRPFDSTIGALRPMPGFWWQGHPSRASHPTPAGRRFLEPYAHAIAEMDVSSLTVGGTSLASLGHEEPIAEFARAFCALPQEPFTTVLGMSDPVCIRELLTGAGHVFYLANRAGFPVDVSLAFSDKTVRVRDLADGKEADLPSVTNRPLPAALPKDFVSEHELPDDEGPQPAQPGATQLVTGALLQVTLAPYELRSYRNLTPGAIIQYAACSVPSPARVRLAQRIESAKSLVAHSTASGDVVATARATLDLINRAWAKHELTRVEYLLDSYPLARLR